MNFHLPFPATLAIAAIIPMIMGFIWYNPKTFGTAWMGTIGKTQEELQQGFNPVLTFGLSYILSFFLAVSINFIVIHQFYVYSVFADHVDQLKDPQSPISQSISHLLHGHEYSFRTFKHGAFHGLLAGLTIALPIIATGGMFERRGFKYIAINAGYWIVTMALMGAFICHFQTLDYNTFK